MRASASVRFAFTSKCQVNAIIRIVMISVAPTRTVDVRVSQRPSQREHGMARVGICHLARKNTGLGAMVSCENVTS